MTVRRRERTLLYIVVLLVIARYFVVVGIPLRMRDGNANRDVTAKAATAACHMRETRTSLLL